MDGMHAKVQVPGAADHGAGAMTTGWPDGQTQVVFIIGDPVAQVKSPAFLTANFRARDVNAVVVPGHVAPGGVDDFLSGVRVTQNMPGVIFTVPHKQAALEFCDHLTDRARFAGSVNVARRTARGWIGDNTDGMGFVGGIAAAGGAVAGKRVLLVGAGGAGSAIAYEFLARGAAHLAIHDIDEARLGALIDRLGPAFPGRLSIGSDDPAGYDIVGNATPLGMRADDRFPVDVGALTPGQFAACVITKPEVSSFIAAARDKGCRTMTGTAMFEAQEGLLIDALLHLNAD